MPILAPWLANVQIRTATQADLPALEWGGEFIYFRRLYHDVYQNACRGRAVIWLAEMPPTGLIGQVFVQLDSARKELADGVSRAYVYGFRVQSPFRSAGVGGRLLDTLEADLQKREFRWVTLNVGRQNLQARRFYERCGYRVIAAEPGIWSYLDHLGQRQEVHEPAWRMEKRFN
jgi:ribosomal protein S18 acetylase RimI-like enzyme